MGRRGGAAVSVWDPRLCIVTAPVARDLAADPIWADLSPFKCEGATNGVLQAWLLADENTAAVAKATDPLGAGVTVYPTLSAMPQALRTRIISVQRSDVRAVAPANWVNPHYKTLFDCGANDYFVVRRAGSWASIRKGEWQAGDAIPPALMRLPTLFLGNAYTAGDGGV